MRFRPVLAAGARHQPARPDRAPAPARPPGPTGTATGTGHGHRDARPRRPAAPPPAPARHCRAPSSRAPPSPRPSGTATTTPDRHRHRPAATAAKPTDASDLAWITDDVAKAYQALDCSKDGATDKIVDDPAKPLVTCSDDGAEKYVLGPVVVNGDQIKDAAAGYRPLSNGQPSSTVEISLTFKSAGTKAYGEASKRMVSARVPRNEMAATLDSRVIVAPYFEAAILDGQASISGSFTIDSARDLASQLKFGALPLSFTLQTRDQISPTLGSEQLRMGLIAGIIGFALVFLYSLAQYRALGLVTVASIVIAALLTYVAIALLGWSHNFRLDMAGVTGLIVAIGVTADSFIVYFERIRDEVREGRPLRAAVDTGWRRARRTILAADGVNFLAAFVLYLLASSNVRGFAFTLGLTTLIDLLIVVLFTHPLVALLSGTKFFGGGHRWSGLDPERLGAKAQKPRYAGRGRVAMPTQRTDRERRERTVINFAALGNDLYTGKRSVDFVGRYKRWYALSGVFVLIAALGLVWHGLNLSLEFRGGSEFRVSEVTAGQDYESPGQGRRRLDRRRAGAAEVTKVGTGTIRVQTEKLNESEIRSVQSALATEFKTDVGNVSASFVGPSWGASVSQTGPAGPGSSSSPWSPSSWRSTSAPGRWPSPGLVALLHDLFITVGIYALAGFEVSPATMIGFLTILGYSLYDTVVVFDKVRENTTEALGNGRMTYAQAANLAVNQTLVRSINTTIVALLPIASILVIGFLFLGPGTLLDLALALFVGIAVGAYSSIFIATPLLVHLRMKEPAGRRARQEGHPLPGPPRWRGLRRPTPRPCSTSPTPRSWPRAAASRSRRPRAPAPSARRTSTRPAVRATSPSAPRSRVDEQPRCRAAGPDDERLARRPGHRAAA